jgi:hypothetical protein
MLTASGDCGGALSSLAAGLYGDPEYAANEMNKRR